MNKNYWIRDEYILTLWLYFKVKNKIASENVSDIIIMETFKMFNSIQTYHGIKKRTMDSMLLRVQNWKHIDPGWKGKGLSGSKTNKLANQIFTEFSASEIKLEDEYAKIKSIYKKIRDNEIEDQSNNFILLKKILKNLNINANFINDTNPFLLSIDDNDFLIFFSAVHSGAQNSESLIRIQIKNKIKDYFLNYVNNNVKFLLLGYDQSTENIISWKTENIFSEFKNKSLFCDNKKLIEADEFGISIDKSNKRKNINDNFPLIFKIDYLSNFLKNIKKNNSKILNQKIQNSDHLNENENSKFFQEILKFHALDFTSNKFSKTKSDINKKFRIRKFISDRNFRNNENQKVQKGSIENLIDKQNLIDRASKQHHEALVNIYNLALQKKIEVYEDPNSFDLFLKYKKKGYLFEVKSINKNNFISQTRSSLVQLQEYYFFYRKDLEEKFEISEINLFTTYNIDPTSILSLDLLGQYINFLNDKNIKISFVNEKNLVYFLDNTHKTKELF